MRSLLRSLGWENAIFAAVMHGVERWSANGGMLENANGSGAETWSSSTGAENGTVTCPTSYVLVNVNENVIFFVLPSWTL